MQAGVLKLTWISFWFLSANLACQTSETPKSQTSELAKTSEVEAIVEKNERTSVSVSQGQNADGDSLLRELWQGGVKQVHVSYSRAQECSGDEGAAACRNGEEWIFEREQKRLKRQQCNCGALQSQEKKLSAKQVLSIEKSILALTTTTSPVPCADTAPRVVLEFFSASAEEPVIFPVNYGQCGSQNQLTPRIEVLGFEQLMAEWMAIAQDKKL